MKINFARQLIRENDMNFTQISEFLGYSSIHYFSRQFKKLCGMTPTEYALSIKAISERPQNSEKTEKTEPMPKTSAPFLSPFRAHCQD